MRIPEEDLIIIRQAFARCFGPEDELWLFGSRVDDNKRGGDIDFYIETQLSTDDGYQAEKLFVRQLCEALGDQKIDVVVKYPHSDPNLLIFRVARARGVRLV